LGRWEANFYMMGWCIVFSILIVLVHLFTPVPEEDQFGVTCSCCGVGTVRIDGNNDSSSLFPEIEFVEPELSEVELMQPPGQAGTQPSEGGNPGEAGASSGGWVGMKRSISWQKLKADFMTEANVDVNDDNVNFLDALASTQAADGGGERGGQPQSHVPRRTPAGRFGTGLGSPDVPDGGCLTTRERYRMALFKSPYKATYKAAHVASPPAPV